MTMYKVTHMYVFTGSSYSMNQRTVNDISPSTTSTVVEDISSPRGSTHIVVVTAVSGSISATSEIVYLQTRMKIHTLNDNTAFTCTILLMRHNYKIPVLFFSSSVF